MRTHSYDLHLTWIGNQGVGTAGYAKFSRDHVVEAPGRPSITGSSDPAFRGDATRWNPEQLLVASRSQCHMLWYLHLAAAAGIVVTAYEDHPLGVMIEQAGGAGQFSQVTLRPLVTIAAGGDADLARRLHADVPAYCFIARSVNFPVHHEPVIVSA